MKTVNNFTDYVTAERVAKNYHAVLSLGWKLSPDCLNPKSRYLFLDFDDVTFESLKYHPDEAPTADHIHQIVNFVRSLEPTDKLLVHCFAGHSRSPAATIIALRERDNLTIYQAKEIIDSYRIPDQYKVEPNDLMLHQYLMIK